jgi:predicted secreted hydrolase
MATDATRYVFDLPAGQAAQVKVRLIFRRAFQALAELKGWTDPDILMAEAMIQVAR